MAMPLDSSPQTQLPISPPRAAAFAPLFGIAPQARPGIGQEAARVRLDYLDGVRALAALYVCFFHAALTSVWSGVYHQLPPDVPEGVVCLTRPFMFGHFGVSVFIILSGYCLMLPVARRGDGRLPGGVPAFLWRRTRRLLPPYYAALGVALLVALLPGMNHPTGTRWDETMPAWDRDSILPHLLLIQNWKADWLFKILAPAWSVAPEWQIYWLFPFVLLPLMRHVGPMVTTITALMLGPVVHFYFRGHYDFVSSGYVGLFATGMLGATISFSENPLSMVFRQHLPWGILTALAWLGFVVIALLRGAEWMEDRHWWMDPIVGFATVCLLIYGCQACVVGTSARSSPILRILQAKPLVQLGGFSYSLYLIHDLLLNLLRVALLPASFSYKTILCFMFGFGIPLCLVCAYGFHLACERPFMNSQNWPARRRWPNECKPRAAAGRAG